MTIKDYQKIFEIIKKIKQSRSSTRLKIEKLCDGKQYLLWNKDFCLSISEEKLNELNALIRIYDSYSKDIILLSSVLFSFKKQISEYIKIFGMAKRSDNCVTDYISKMFAKIEEECRLEIGTFLYQLKDSASTFENRNGQVNYSYDRYDLVRRLEAINDYKDYIDLVKYHCNMLKIKETEIENQNRKNAKKYYQMIAKYGISESTFEKSCSAARITEQITEYSYSTETIKDETLTCCGSYISGKLICECGNTKFYYIENHPKKIRIVE